MLLVGLQLAACGAVAYRLEAHLIGGKTLFDLDGSILKENGETKYVIFAEERAVVSPTPEIVIRNLDDNKAIVPLQGSPATGPAAPDHPHKFNGVKTITRSRTATESRTYGEWERSVLEWSVKSAPHNLNLNLGGPRRWVSNARQRFVLDGWIFPAPGTYEIAFNVTFFNRVRFYKDAQGKSVMEKLLDTQPPTHFRWTWSIEVQRQPAFLVNGPAPFATNGSKWTPGPIAIAQSVLGGKVETSTVRVTLEFQAWPVGATWTGRLTKNTAENGQARFDDIIVSIPGKYTYRFTAVLSDGSSTRATSVLVDVLRAEPITLQRLTGGDGISRFHFYETLSFRIFDSVGADYDPRLNLTLTLSSNNPEYSYDGFDTRATLGGITSVKQNKTGYLFTFPGVSIDLPGVYELMATLPLPTSGRSLIHRFTVTIKEAPTWTFDSVPLRQNRVARFSVHNEFEPFFGIFASILFMLSTKADCSVQASDMIEWNNTVLIEQGGVLTTSTTTLPATTVLLGVDGTTTTAAPPAAPITIRNFTLVPWYRGQGPNAALHVCMKIPCQPTFGPMVQRYLQQFDEGYPFTTQVDVIGFDECQPLTNTEAFQYQLLGWETAEGERSYGCALAFPAAGTIAPCSCPATLTCSEMSHDLFTPPWLNIGRCNCCAGWIMGVASIIIAVAFLIMMYVIYAYV